MHDGKNIMSENGKLAETHMFQRCSFTGKSTSHKNDTDKSHANSVVNSKSPTQTKLSTIFAHRRDTSDLELEEIKFTLKQFDLNSKYGPCVGITRQCRLKRAKRLKLDPPYKVQEILTDHRIFNSIPDYNFDLWYRELVKGIWIEDQSI